ncbi:MAG: threonine synthase [Euryarchaeota archaeon]|nr:threonine synthase [Euryarchaeota archaeon]
MKPGLRCFDCHRPVHAAANQHHCPRCGGLLDVIYTGLRPRRFHGRGVWRYKAMLPCRIPPVTLQEGATPLYRCPRLEEELGLREVYVKHEGMNPTGSFKDRGMTVGVTMALQLGMKRVACASTGNTSASLSLYAAKAGLDCVVLLPQGKVALGKISQAMMHGARVLSIKGNFDASLKLVAQLCESGEFYLLNSVNAYRLEGQKTAAYEICEELGRAPDRLVLPVGNAGNISAYWKGFDEFQWWGYVKNRPRMLGVQAQGAAPIVHAHQTGKREVTPVRKPETVATAIRIGNPVNAPKAIRALQQSKGDMVAVTDKEILQAQRDLARLEGIGVEPASAASLAGLRKMVKQKEIARGETIVMVTTGHLLKDPETILQECGRPTEVEGNMGALKRALLA